MPIIAAFMVPHPPCIIPGIGGSDYTYCQKTINAYDTIAKKIAALAPDTIVLSSPHAECYSDYFQIADGEYATGSFASFGAPNVSFRLVYDEEMANEITALARMDSFPAGNVSSQERELDHGTMVPLYFINKYYKSYRLVRLGLSGLPLLHHYNMGVLIQKAANVLKRRVVYIASGDLSHCQKEDGPYGYKEEGPRYDELIMKTMGAGNFGELFNYDPNLLEQAEECGHRSFAILAGALDRLAIEATPVSHEAPFGVGYGICEYKITGSDPSRAFGDLYKSKILLSLTEKRSHADPLVKLAYDTLQLYLKEGKKNKIRIGADHSLKDKAGVFVSLHEMGSLRGCIGTLEGRFRNIGEEIIENTIQAASSDPRFAPVELGEFPFIDISVDVLSPLEPIDSMADLDPKKYGVVVAKGNKRGVLLPNLPGITNAVDQVAIARKKAKIDIDEKVTLFRFTSTRHE